MSSQLWILNSSLVAIWLVSFIIGNMVQVTPPRVSLPKMPASEQKVVDEKATGKQGKSPFEKIYRYDMFGTSAVKQEKPTRQSLVSPIPDFTPPAATPPPPLPTYDFVASLELTVKGIIMADEEQRCVVMIEDESKQEAMYHIGDKIKDAQIIKIAKNYVVLLRGVNGQLETFYLRKDDPFMELDPQNPWKYIAKTLEDGTIEIDPQNFVREVDSLGNFLERINVVGTSFQKGSAIGIKVGAIDKGELGEVLGLQAGDVIIALNGISLGQHDQRLAAYDVVTKAQFNDVITVTVQRGGVNKDIKYSLKPLRKEIPSIFGGKDGQAKVDQKLVPSRLQEREKLIKDFKQKHPAQDQNEAVSRIRQRLLENLKARVKDSRVR